MSHNSNLKDDEIDLRELFAALWSHKLLITLCTGLSIFLAGYYSITAERKFTAEAIFKLEENNNSGLSLSGELASIASIAGIAGGSRLGSGTEHLLERLSGREFILSMIKNSALDKDPYFNTYNPKTVKDPFWKATIKSLVGWQKSNIEDKLIIENAIVNNFRANVNFNQTEGGSIQLSVRHISPEKASLYANSFMEEIRLLIQKENSASQTARLTYLSETLADALQDMEKAQENLKDYALENSTMAEENFISGSLKLNEIRDEKRKVEEISKLLSILGSLIRSGNLDSGSYDVLRSSHPLVDDIDFRRILGMSEIISAWTWPELETVETVNATLKDRIKRLDADIENIKENAKISATSADDLAKFTREARIAEATYTVLIEQVKSHSLVAGFQPYTFKVFEYATQPISPSSPNRNILLMIGTMLGFFLGCALALINPMHWGVYYRRATLLSDIDPELALISKSIKRLSRQSILKMLSLIEKHNFQVLNEADVKLSNSNIIYVFNSGGRPSAPDVARLLATKSSQSGRKVLICDTTGQSNLELQKEPRKNISGHVMAGLNNNLNVMTETNGASFFTSNKFSSTIKSLSKDFDQIFICTSKINAFAGLMALKDFETSLVLIAGLRRSRKLDIKAIRNRQEIDLLFYG